VAVSPHELSARRAAVLLRCQKAREQRRQRDASRAERSSTAAGAAEQRARADAGFGRVAGAERLRQACADLGGRKIRPEELATLPALEQSLAREAEQRDKALTAATEAARTARGAADAAREALLTERRATEKRSKLTVRAQTLWHRAVDAREEMERDQQVADTWRAGTWRADTWRSA
jgi:hypothetical protein